MIIARCPYCRSIWVCWNWTHWSLDTLCELNPNQTREELSLKLRGHECWDCGNAFETPNKIKNGIPYWILTRQKYLDPKYKLKQMLEKLY